MTIILTTAYVDFGPDPRAPFVTVSVGGKTTCQVATRLSVELMREEVQALNTKPFVECGVERRVTVDDAHGSSGQKRPRVIAGYCRGRNLRYVDPCWCQHGPLPTAGAMCFLSPKRAPVQEAFVVRPLQGRRFSQFASRLSSQYLSESTGPGLARVDAESQALTGRSIASAADCRLAALRRRSCAWPSRGRSCWGCSAGGPCERPGVEAEGGVAIRRNSSPGRLS